jgi:hypothetical protein
VCGTAGVMAASHAQPDASSLALTHMHNVELAGGSNGSRNIPWSTVIWHLAAVH